MLCFIAAKFNCSVPGTLVSTLCPSTTNDMTTMPILSDTQELSTSDSVTDSTTPVVSQPNTLEIGSPLFYGIVGAGAAVIIMTLLCLICICVMLGCRRECKCECHALNYITSVLKIISYYNITLHFWYQVDLELGLPTTKVN